MVLPMNWLLPVTCHKPGLTLSGWLLLAAKRMVVAKRVAKEILFRLSSSEDSLVCCAGLTRAYTRAHRFLKAPIPPSTLGCARNVATPRAAREREYYAQRDAACVKGREIPIPRMTIVKLTARFPI